MPYPYRFQRLSAAQAQTISRLHAAGVTADSLAREYGVTPRTIYRVLRRSAEPTSTVRLGPWHATFALTSEGPVQIEPWRATP